MAPREEPADPSLEEPLLSSSSSPHPSNDSNDNDPTVDGGPATNGMSDEDKNITITLPSCCGLVARRRTFSMNHNVVLNLLLCVLYGVSDSLWSGTVLAAYLKKLGHSQNSWVGNVEAANGLASLFSALPVGYLADKWGRSKVLRVGGVLLIATAILHAMIMEWIGVDETKEHPHSELYLAAIMSLWGIGGGIVMGPSQALFADSTPQGKRSQYYTYLFVCFTVSSCVGPLVSIILFQTLGDNWDLYDLRIIIYVGMGMEAMNGFLMMFFDDRKALDEPEDDEAEFAPQPSATPPGNEELQNLLLTAAPSDEEQPLVPPTTPTTTATSTTAATEEDDTQVMENTTTPITSTTNAADIANHLLRQKYKGWIPYILFLHGLIFALGSGMTVKFFPLFFKDEVGMSPTQVQVVYFIVPLVLAAFGGVGQQISTKLGLGRVLTALIFKLLGVSMLYCMVFFKKYLDQRPLLLVPVYVLRTALMNASYPLEESILMDNVSKKERGRWKSLESISVFGWCGSAALGGWASDHAHDDYTFTFFITAIIQSVGILTWCLLWPLVPKEEAPAAPQQPTQSQSSPAGQQHQHQHHHSITPTSSGEHEAYFDAVERPSEIPSSQAGTVAATAAPTTTATTTTTTNSNADNTPPPPQSLQSRFPTLTECDIERFEEMFVDDDLIQKLDEYAQFRTLYKLDTADNMTSQGTDDDAADWKWAAQLAVTTAKTHEGDLIPGVPEGGSSTANRKCELDPLPQLCFAHKMGNTNDGAAAATPVLTLDGHPIIHYLAGRLDNNKVSSEIHAVCIALYLERKALELNLDAEDGKGAVLMVDARKGKGWPNHSVLMVAGFLKILTKALHKNHPGRLEKLIIYPVPTAGVYAFKMMKRWLPPVVAENIILVNGSDAIDAPVPKKELTKFVAEDILDHMETIRKANFD